MKKLLLKNLWISFGKNKRFIKHDLNRCINNYSEEYDEDDYEIKRWKEIKKLIDENNPDAWLDLHTVSAPNATPYLFSWLEWYDLAKEFWISNIAIKLV